MNRDYVPVPAEDWRWVEYMLGLLVPIASRSKDPRTRVGCVIVRPDWSIAVTGYNGFPPGVREQAYMVDEAHRATSGCSTLDYSTRWAPAEKSWWVTHAEQNAVNTAAREGVALRGCYAFVSWHPCHQCAGALIGAGVRRVYLGDGEVAKHWVQSTEVAATKFRETGVTVYHGQ